MTVEQPQSVHMLLLQEKKEQIFSWSYDISLGPEKVSNKYLMYAFLSAIFVLYHLPDQKKIVSHQIFSL